MKVLLSIKPEFAFKIFDGSKKFEFRKSVFKNASVRTVVVYASHPIQKVIGEFEVDEIYCRDPKLLWEMTKDYSGISEDIFFEYFFKRELGYAIKIKNVKQYETPLSLADDFNGTTPPQSFAYLAKVASGPD